MIFDIKDFYPSIREKLLIDSLNFAEKYTNITKKDKNIINHARKSLLFSGDDTWMKRQSGLFDVTMGAFDGAEVCELVGSFLLNEISKTYAKNDIGLYRDDGLAIFRNKSGPQSERIKKHIQSIFKSKGLDIVIQSNIKIVNYLDITLNLNDSTYRPYHKPGNEITYIHKESNHPPNIIKQIPLSIESRLSTLSSNEDIFNESVHIYEDALKKSGYNHKLTYTKNTNNTRKNRNRNVIWFNPPYSANVTTNIGKSFLYLIDKHFPAHHKFRKLFNRNNIKISYSCMKNVGSIISSHNKNILNTAQTTEQKQCNCINNKLCPLNNKCLSKNIIYQAKISSSSINSKEKIYIGVSETKFKLRYANHKKSFTSLKYKNDTELSKEFWKIKENGDNPIIKWSVLKYCKPYSQSSNRCNLCLNEKTELALFSGDNLLNKKTELVSKCVIKTNIIYVHTTLKTDVIALGCHHTATSF